MRNGCLFLLGTVVLSASIASAQVMSPDIVAADGTSGQNIAIGSGIKTGHIQDNAVSSLKIGPGEVKANNIGAGAITENKILDGAVTGAKIASGVTVSFANVAGSVPASGITGTVSYAAEAKSATTVPASGVIGTVSNATTAVTAGSVPASGITGVIGTSKLAPNSVTSAIIADGTIGSLDLANSSVSSSKIAVSAITSAAIANSSVTAAKIAPNAVGKVSIATDAVTASKISAIHGVRVECNGGCGDSTLGQICDGLMAGWEPVSLTCMHVKPATGGYACGGNNICNNWALNRTSPLNYFCEDGSGWDAVVFCMAP